MAPFSYKLFEYVPPNYSIGDSLIVQFEFESSLQMRTALRRVNLEMLAGSLFFDDDEVFSELVGEADVSAVVFGTRLCIQIRPDDHFEHLTEEHHATARRLEAKWMQEGLDRYFVPYLLHEDVELPLVSPLRQVHIVPPGPRRFRGRLGYDEQGRTIAAGLLALTGASVVEQAAFSDETEVRDLLTAEPIPRHDLSANDTILVTLTQGITYSGEFGLTVKTAHRVRPDFSDLTRVASLRHLMVQIGLESAASYLSDEVALVQEVLIQKQTQPDWTLETKIDQCLQQSLFARSLSQATSLSAIVAEHMHWLDRQHFACTMPFHREIANAVARVNEGSRKEDVSRDLFLQMIADAHDVLRQKKDARRFYSVCFPTQGSTVFYALLTEFQLQTLQKAGLLFPAEPLLST